MDGEDSVMAENISKIAESYRFAIICLQSSIPAGK